MLCKTEETQPIPKVCRHRASHRPLQALPPIGQLLRQEAPRMLRQRHARSRRIQLQEGHEPTFSHIP